MNKKGFTLVELLAVISILVLMALIIGVNITSILKSTEESNETFDDEQIEKAACVFADSEIRKEKNPTSGTSIYSTDYTNKCNGTNCTILVNDLVKSGLIPDTYLKDYNNKNVTVKYINGEKKCELN